MEFSTIDNVIIKKEKNYNLPDVAIKSANVFIKTEPVNLFEANSVDYGKISCSIKPEFDIKNEEIEDSSEISKEVKTLESCNKSESNVETKCPNTLDQKHLDPLDVCATQLDVNNEEIKDDHMLKVSEENCKHVESSRSNQPSIQKKPNKDESNELTCKICRKMFIRKSHLVCHLKIHYGVKPFVCEICGNSFHQKGNMQRHMRIHKFNESNSQNDSSIQNDTKKFICELCGKSFDYKCSLIQHLNIHTGVKSFVCDCCGKFFSRKSEVKRHMVIHTGARPHKCHVCEKSFNDRSDLVRHKLIHSGDKPFKCDLCDQKFRQKGHLDQHKRIHTGEKPFECDECGKTFTVKSALTSHKRTHTGEKPYCCDICNRTFTQKIHLNEHKRRTHKS